LSIPESSLLKKFQNQLSAPIRGVHIHNLGGKNRLSRGVIIKNERNLNAKFQLSSVTNIYKGFNETKRHPVSDGEFDLTSWSETNE